MTTRHNKRLAAAILCILGTLTAAADAQTNYEFNLPRQPLADALRAIGSLTTTNILFEPETVENLTAPPVHGLLSPEEAINRVLAGTRLVVEQTAANSLLIAPAGVQAASKAVRPLTNHQSDSPSLGKSGLRLALAEAARNEQENNSAGEQKQNPESSDKGSQGGIEEVVVTAMRRAESSLDVPMGLTALSGQELESEQSYRLEDFVGKVPGLNMSETTGSQLVIRGLASTAGSVNAPVATYIDETPLVGVGGFSGAHVNTPNLDTFDVARIEVLKGPQGTLYGANALGGLLKYVTNAPDPSRFDARMQAGASTVAHSDGTGYNLHGMINVPLADDLAFRLVAYHNEYPGFIDDPARGREDINDVRVAGGRASLLWAPTTDFSLRFNVIYQKRRWGGLSFEDVNPGTLTPTSCTLCQARDVDQPGDTDLQFYNATVTWDLGPAQLLSSTTYDEFTFLQQSDITPQAGLIADLLIARPLGLPPGTFGVWVADDYRGKEYVHETRLASKIGQDWNWQTGIYYTSKETAKYQPQRLIDRANNVVLQNALSLAIGGSVLPATYKEFAAFANLGYQIAPTLDVSIGGRISENSQTFEQKGTGFTPSSPLTNMSGSVFTYSADARWRLTPGHMIYARVAEGFAPGGPNVAAFNEPIPAAYGSSSTTNYELGYKSTLLDDHLTVELAVYQIDWNDIQLRVPAPSGYTSIANGGKAVSRGAEWVFTYVPLSGLTLAFNGAYNDAHLTSATPAGVGGHAGERLPITPRWQGALSADYKWPLFGNYSGFAGVDWRYLGERLAEFETSHPRQQMPSYDIVDLRAGIEAQRWTLGFYVKNVGDTVALSYVTDATLVYGLQRASVSTPRTVGVELTTKF
jgi:iron complex outermembrane recepter protein